MKTGEMLDGEGGHTVYAKLIPAARSRKLSGLPIGLANHVRLVRDVAAGDFVATGDVELADKLQAVRVRREMEAQAQDSPPDTGGDKLDAVMGPLGASG